MKTKIKLFIYAAAAAWATGSLPAQTYNLHYTPSPSEAGGAIAAYNAVWESTNSALTNIWTPFATVLPGTTKIPIPGSVPSPAYLGVRAIGTNFIFSTITNVIYYDTNALAAIYTNTPAPPLPPGTNSISN